MHIYQANNTILQSHNQQQNKNTHINFIFSLWQMSVTLIFWLDSLDARNLW